MQGWCMPSTRTPSRSFATSLIARATQRAPPPPQIYKRSATQQPAESTTVEPPIAQPAPKDARFGPRDLERGRQASLKAAQTGKLDARYKPAARRVLAIIVSLPVVIVLGYELFQRRFGDKQQKISEWKKSEAAVRADEG